MLSSLYRLFTANKDNNQSKSSNSITNDVILLENINSSIEPNEITNDSVATVNISNKTKDTTLLMIPHYDIFWLCIVAVFLGGNLNDIANIEIALTNKKYRLHLPNGLFSNIDWDIPNIPVYIRNDLQIYWLQKRSLRLYNVKLTIQSAIDFKMLFEYTSNLHTLDLSSCSNRIITNDVLFLLSNHGSINITELNLNSCSGITNVGLRHIINKMKLLRILKLNSCYSISDDIIKDFSKELPLLQELDISSCDKITVKGISSLSIGYNRQLISLSIDDCPRINASGIESIITNCTNMKEFRSRRNNITNELLQLLSEKCLHINTLNLSDNRNISDYGLIPMITSLGSNLLKLYLYSCSSITDDLITIITTYCYNLLHLNIGYNNITNESITKLRNCHKLTHIDLTCLSVNDGTILSITNECPNIKEMALFGNDISDIGLTSILEKEYCLTALDIRSCHMITSQLISRMKLKYPWITIYSNQ